MEKYQEIIMDKTIFLNSLVSKKNDSYKNINGRSLIIAGSYGYAGAAIMNLLGALHTNNGYNTALIDESIYPIVSCQAIEAVYHFTNNYNLKNLIDNNDAVLFGSGAVNMINKKAIFDELLQKSTIPLILDGEAFNLLKFNTYLLNYAHCPLILTPHLGEFARITHTDIQLIKQDPLKYAKAFVNSYPVTLVLKSEHTIVINQHQYYINQTGNPVLAKAGSGDILAGLMVGFLSQEKDCFQVATKAVYLAGALADLAVSHHHPLTILPKDILKELDNFLKIS